MGKTQADLGVRPTHFGVSRGNGGGCGACGGVDGQGGAGRAAPGRNAHLVVAGLVAHLRGDFGSARRGVRFQMQLQQENRGAFVSLRVKLQVRVVGLLGRRLEYPDLFHGGIRGHFDGGGDGPRAGRRIDVPARIDTGFQARQNQRSRRCGRRFERQRPLHVVGTLRQRREGRQQEESLTPPAGHWLTRPRCADSRCRRRIRPPPGWHS